MSITLMISVGLIVFGMILTSRASAAANLVYEELRERGVAISPSNFNVRFFEMRGEHRSLYPESAKRRRMIHYGVTGLLLFVSGLMLLLTWFVAHRPTGG